MIEKLSGEPWVVAGGMEAAKKALVPFVPPPLRFSPSELGGILQGALHPRRWATRATYDALRSAGYRPRGTGL